MSLEAGARLGPYEIVAPLGAGGMGEVFRARDARLGRDVAVKVLPASVAGDPERRARFEQEARAVAALSHPNILAIFDVGSAPSTGSGQATVYAVTELLEGETLRERLGGGPLPVRRATEIATQIARGLTAAHDKGLVHRDLKPENVFLLRDGQVKILDFGLAKATAPRGHDGETIAATDPGTVLGTVGYMAPEQVRGETVDARADLFALGAVLYEMLSGRRAFQRNTTAETMTAILKEDPPELTASRADLPPALESVVRHCLERDPSDRFQSARDLAFNLQSASHASGSGPAATVGAGRRIRFSRREGLAWALAVVLAAALGAALFRKGPPAVPAPVGRFQVGAPAGSVWGAPIGAPDGSNGGTISPDGTMLAFAAADASGKSLLYLRPLDSFAARPLPGTEFAAFPFWSPDSRHLGFFTQTRLKRIAVAGGPAQTLTELASTPRGGSWNQEGVIVFATAGSAIYRMRSDGGPFTPVTKTTAENAAHQWPSFLPDGQRFLYYSASTHAIYVGSLDGSTDKRLLPADSNALFVQPNQILFLQEGTLLAKDFNASTLEVSGEARPVAEQMAWSPAPWNLAAFSASSSGTLTYRLGGGNHSQFVWLDRAGRQLSTVGPVGDFISPTLSPDETMLAFTRRDDQAAGDVWTLDLARQTLSRITFGAGTEMYPVWSSDGTSLFFQSGQEGLVATVKGGSTRRVFTTPSNPMLIPGQVSTDGKTLLFFGDIGGTTGFDIFALPLSGDAKPTAAIQGPLTDAEPALSPDQHWMAYASTETGGYEVFVQPFPPTGAKRQVSTNGGRQPVWRRDGRELFFVTNDRKFYVVDVRPGGAELEFGAPRFLFDIPSNTVSVRNSYVPSRDGQRFLVNRLLDTAVPPINVVVNWASTLRK